MVAHTQIAHDLTYDDAGAINRSFCKRALLCTGEPPYLRSRRTTTPSAVKLPLLSIRGRDRIREWLDAAPKNLPTCGNAPNAIHLPLLRQQRLNLTLQINLQVTLVDLKNYFENKLEAVKKDILQELTVEIKKVKSRAASIETKYDLILGKINTLESTSKDAHKKQVDQEKRIVALEEQINQLRTEMKSLNEYKVSTDQQLAEFDAVKRNLNDVEQRARLTNLEVFGVPERKNEDLVATMVEIASHCECEFPVKREDFEYVTRVQPRTKQPGLPKTIVAKFKSIQLKDAFLSAARKRRGMTTTDIKITGDSKKVYVNEHLTSTNKAFLKAAREKCKSAGFSYIWTRNTKIYVRKNDKTPAIRLRSLDQIDDQKNST
ncbi:hypothetical protein NE865_03446 [Phthorimaea operculella]|nr:hypothetical protein NE865_03446 [Phthorimaea operculella]